MSNHNTSAIDSRLLRTVGLTIGLFILTWTVSEWIVSGNNTYMILSVLACIGVAMTMTVVRDWRIGVFLFLCWLVLEDMIRKYLGNSLIIFFAKDVIIGITYFSMWLARRKNELLIFKPRFIVPLAIFFWLAVAQVFNPYSPHVMFGLLGLKTYFYYIPLMYAGYALLRTEDGLHKILMLNMWIGIVVAGLGVLQSVGGGAFLNPEGMAPELYELSHLTREAPQSHLVTARATSVFVSDGRFSTFLMLLFLLSFGTAGYLLLRSKRGRAVVFFAVGIVALATVMSGSRGSLLYMIINSVVLSVAVYWGAPWRHRQTFRMGKALRWMAMFATIAIGLTVILAPDAIRARWAFFSETMSPTSSTSELSWRAWEYPEKNLESIFEQPHWAVGNGIGVASLGTQYVTQLVGVRSLGLGAESGYATLIIEFGILGPLVWTLWTFSLFFAAWRVVRKLKQTPFFPIGFAIFWYAFILLGPFTFYGLNVYQNYLTNAYLWLVIGILFRLPELLKEEQRRQAEGKYLADQQRQEESIVDLQGAPLFHGDAGP